VSSPFTSRAGSDWQALIASVDGARYFADRKKPHHRLRRLLSEFIGVSGLTFVLSGGAAILVLFGGGAGQACASTSRSRPGGTGTFVGSVGPSIQSRSYSSNMRGRSLSLRHERRTLSAMSRMAPVAAIGGSIFLRREISSEAFS